MDDAELRTTIEMAMMKAREIILAGEDVIRVFFAQDKNGKSHIVMAPSTGRDEDATLIAYLKTLFAILGIQSYCMMSEVWISERSTLAGPAPSEDPNRKEALMAVAVHRVRGESGEYQVVTRAAQAEITRNPTRVGDIVWDTMSQISGRFTQLLPSPDMPDCPDVPAALAVLAAMTKAAGGGLLQTTDLEQRTVH